MRPTQCVHTQGSCGNQGSRFAPRVLTAPAHTKVPLRISTALPRTKKDAVVLFLPRSTFTSAACRFLKPRRFSWQAWDIGAILMMSWPPFDAIGSRHFSSVWHSIVCARATTWQAWAEWEVVRSFLAEGAIFGELGRYCERLESLGFWSGRHFWLGTLVHDDHFAKQAQHFACLGFIFCGRPNASETSMKKWLQPR